MDTDESLVSHGISLAQVHRQDKLLVKSGGRWSHRPASTTIMNKRGKA